MLEGLSEALHVDSFGVGPSSKPDAIAIGLKRLLIHVLRIW